MIGSAMVCLAWMYCAPAAQRHIESRWLAEHCERTRMLCLTYDDGPGESLTHAVLSLLKERGAEATFFLLGQRAEAAPAVADALLVAGHELCCHSYEHLNAWKHWPRRVARDIERGYESLSRWVKPNALFRPPYGKSTPLTRRQVRRRGARLVRWTHDMRDTTHGPLPAVDEVVRAPLRSGGVVLLHDFDRDGPDAQERAEFVLAVTERLLCGARECGMAVVTMSEYLAGGGRI